MAKENHNNCCENDMHRDQNDNGCNHDDCGCGDDCNCGHDHDHQYINLTLENDEEVKCLVIGLFQVKEQEYIALVPEGEETAYIYRFFEDENGPMLTNIESDEEYDLVVDKFNEIYGE